MKKILAMTLLFSVLALSACGTPNTAVQDAEEPAAQAVTQEPAVQDAEEPAVQDAAVVPELHAIPYPDDYPTAYDDYGASAFGGMLNHGDSQYYVFHDFYNMSSQGDLHILHNFQTYQQTTEYTCGAASALMVLHWFGVDDYDEMQLAERMETDTSKGLSVENMARFFTDLGWAVDSHGDVDYRFDSAAAVQEYFVEQIDAGVPVMVDWSDWSGHWQVVVGLDGCGTDSPYDDVLILADPYDVTDHYQDGYYVFPLGRFVEMWREGPCVQKADPYRQPFVTAYPAA